MKVKVKLFATLREGRFDIEDHEYSSGTTIQQIVHQLDIPEEKVSIIFVNGRHADLTHILSNEDTLALFPPVGGG